MVVYEDSTVLWREPHEDDILALKAFMGAVNAISEEKHYPSRAIERWMPQPDDSTLFTFDGGTLVYRLYRDGTDYVVELYGELEPCLM